MVYNFGLRLKSLREKRLLSQADVAARLEVTRSTISGYECNTITPSVEQLVKLAILYNASLDYSRTEIKEQKKQVRKRCERRNPQGNGHGKRPGYPTCSESNEKRTPRADGKN